MRNIVVIIAIAISIMLSMGCGSLAADHAKLSDNVVRDGRTININKAEIEELMTIPHIGKSTAIKIIEFRQLNGPFENIESIMLIDGISERRFKQIKHFLIIE